MLRRWFKKDKLNNADPAVRLRGVAELDPAADLDKLAAIARQDPTDDVRHTALERITSKEVLITFLDEPVTADAAANKLASQLKLPEDAELLHKAEVLRAYLKNADEQATQAASEYLHDPEQIALLTIQARGQAKDRLFTHSALRSESGLHTLERLSRSRDKKSNRHARVLLDALKKAKQHHADASARLTEIDQGLERAISDLEQTSASAPETARIARLQSNRSACIDEIETQRSVVESLISDTDFRPIPPAPVVPEFTTSSPVENSTLTDFEQGLKDAPPEALLNQWAKISSAFHDDENPSTRQHYLRLAELMSQVTAAHEKIQSWDKLSRPSGPSSDLQQDRQTWQAWLKSCRSVKKSLHWPSSVRAPKALAEIDQEISRAETQLQAMDEHLQAQHRTARTAIEDALSATRTALEENHYQQSVAAIKRARMALAEHDSENRPAYERALASLSAQLAELKDWQKYATLPKREELLAELRDIAENPLDPPDQADRLRRLRQQWQELGIPASADERSLQQQFDEQAEQAYAPCKTYYAEQAAHRAANLTSREALCDQLSSYLELADWGNMDYRAAEKIMRTARQEWRRYHPCERKALKPVEKRFEALQQSLYEKIKAEWARNVARKEAIVIRAQALLELDDGAEMAEQAKELQQEWRTVGPTPRAIDQRLWQSFRGICDDVFKQRQDAHEAIVAETSRKVIQLDAAIDDFADALDKELSRQAYDQLNRAVEALVDGARIPKKTLDRLRKVRQAYENGLRAKSKQQANAQLQQLLAWDRALSSKEIALDEGKLLHPYFKQRTDETASRESLLRLVLEAEIIAGLSSPSGDQDTRMALQVELMNKGQRNTGQHDPHNLLKPWCELAKFDVDDLQDRFATAVTEIASSGA